MIITPEFVFVHCPKTGGTFVVSSLQELFCPNAQLRVMYKLRTKLGVRIPFFNYRYKLLRVGEHDTHAWCEDIPEKDGHKAIVSCIRNPYDLYVSECKFGWWKKHLDGHHDGLRSYFYDVDVLKRKFPNVLELDFLQFLNATWEFNTWINTTLERHPDAKGLGLYAHRFIYFYCRNHDYVFDAAHDPKLLVERVKENMYDVHFLRQDNLNRDLYEFLLSKGYDKDKIEFILDKARVNVSRERFTFEDWYNNELKDQVRKREDLIFQLFPEFDN